ncbi:hypothetical protein PV04_02267 [Phialophora macrospora]|uniref:Uncharacterized protein n=1 Tax=Phialophora macrospora TaxID=1851006 RepID=A0A0D2FTV2_9EURO|nr:hypothetical protein PV04_02267 [Phialophora macrospora]
MPDPTFVNYSHPSDQTDRLNRRIVASYIGTHYRNRSRPSARKAAKADELSPKGSPGGLTVEDARPPKGRTLSRSRSRNSSPGSSQASVGSLHPRSLGHDRHGYRSDPFSAYPIEFRDCIPAAVDYFLHYYGPAHLIRPEVLSAEAGAIALRQYFQYALQNSLMFEALVALAQANLTAHRWSDGPDKDALFHYSRSLQRLREVLSQQHGYAPDAILFTIIALMGVDFMMNDIVAFEMHLGGLRQIVALRGGVDQLGWPTILKPYLIGMESFWAYMAKNNTKELLHSIPSPSYLDLQHPYHRYPVAGLDELISPLPAGFRALALHYRLSVPVMTLVNRVVTSSRYINQVEGRFGAVSPGPPNAANMQETEYAVRLLACTDLTLVERSVCIGMLTSILDRTRTERFSPLYIQHMRYHAEELCLWQDMFEDRDRDLAEFYLWVAIDIAGTMMPPKIPFLPRDYKEDARFRLLMVVMQKYGHLGWTQALAILEKFIAEPRGVESWHNSWKLGVKHMDEMHP